MATDGKRKLIVGARGWCAIVAVFLYAVPMTKEAERIIGLYRRHANAWADRRSGRPVERKWLDRFRALLPENPSVLDMGCGSGEPVGLYLADNGCAMTGIDASPELVTIARGRVPNGTWMVADMRTLALPQKFGGIIAWNSLFHLTPGDQRMMFGVFRRHAAAGAPLMFTSGPGEGEAIGTFEGEPLYHASLASEEYRALLDANDFDVVDHVIEDPDCGGQTVWLAQFRT